MPSPDVKIKSLVARQSENPDKKLEESLGENFKKNTQEKIACEWGRFLPNNPEKA